MARRERCHVPPTTPDSADNRRHTTPDESSGSVSLALKSDPRRVKSAHMCLVLWYGLSPTL